jgi:hypothetical protein
MKQPIICIAAKGYMWHRSPAGIKGVMQKQICQNRTDHSTLKGAHIPLNECAIVFVATALSTSVPQKQHPSTFAMVAQRSHQEFMIDMIKQPLDVELYNPVITPASLTRFGNSIMSRLARPVAKGIFIKYGFKDRFQHPLHHGLSNPIQNSRYTQYPLSSCFLRDWYRPDRWREVTSL